jgi:hypothetical protein
MYRVNMIYTRNYELRHLEIPKSYSGNWLANLAHLKYSPGAAYGWAHLTLLF